MRRVDLTPARRRPTSWRARGLALVLLAALVVGGGVSTAPVSAQAAAGSLSYELVTGAEQTGVLRGDAAIYVTPAAGIARVRFYVDPTPRALEASRVAGEPAAVATAAPFAFGGPAGLDTRSLADGPHTLVAAIDLADGRTMVRTARVQVRNGGPALLFEAQPLRITVPAGARVERSLPLRTSTGEAVRYSIESDAAWLRTAAAAMTPAAGASGSAPVVMLDASGLAPGEYTATLTATAYGYAPAHTTVTLAVAPAADCTPLNCSQVKVAAPYNLAFDQSHGGLPDKNGTGTGFTWVDKPTVSGAGYIPANLEVDTAAGVLKITTTPGIAFLAENNQDNALGVGIDAGSQVFKLDTRLVNFPPMTGNLEQAGLWYGADDDNYLKLVVIYEPDGAHVQFVEERGGALQQHVVTPAVALTGATLRLQLRANPAASTVTAYYGLNDAALQEFHSFTVPPALFNGTGAAIDPAVGTAVFGGIFASDRFLQGVAVFQFDSFSLMSEGGQLIRLFLPFAEKTGP